mmetsp:Transcript_128057/g.332049  ORF Transcript_128057/g.332049 Transcript_128057/m.332049 type:complete len:211 (-) Transcript_128057:154-786(-)
MFPKLRCLAIDAAWEADVEDLADTESSSDSDDDILKELLSMESDEEEGPRMCHFSFMRGTHKASASCRYEQAPGAAAFCAPGDAKKKAAGFSLAPIPLMKMDADLNVGSCTDEGHSDILRCFFTPQGRSEETPFFLYDEENKVKKTAEATREAAWLLAWFAGSTYSSKDDPSDFTGVPAYTKTKIEAAKAKIDQMFPKLRCLAKDAPWLQ